MKRAAVVLALLLPSCATLELGPLSAEGTLRCRDMARRRDCRECCQAHTPRYGGLTWSTSPVTGEPNTCKCYEKKREAE